MQVHFRAHTDQKGDRKERGVKILKMYLNEKVQTHNKQKFEHTTSGRYRFWGNGAASTFTDA
jgi:hypothetical protein